MKIEMPQQQLINLLINLPTTVLSNIVKEVSDELLLILLALQTIKEKEGLKVYNEILLNIEPKLVALELPDELYTLLSNIK